MIQIPKKKKINTQKGMYETRNCVQDLSENRIRNLTRFKRVPKASQTNGRVRKLLRPSAHWPYGLRYRPRSAATSHSLGVPFTDKYKRGVRARGRQRWRHSLLARALEFPIISSVGSLGHCVLFVTLVRFGILTILGFVWDMFHGYKSFFFI